MCLRDHSLFIGGRPLYLGAGSLFFKLHFGEGHLKKCAVVNVANVHMQNSMSCISQSQKLMVVGLTIHLYIIYNVLILDELGGIMAE